MKDHESNRSIRQRDQQLRRRYRNVRPHSLPAESHSFVGMARETAAMPPACEKSGIVIVKPLETGCDTHTHTHTHQQTT